jgi:hypothetical protein
MSQPNEQTQVEMINPSADVVNLRNWNDQEADIYPLILKRSPLSYQHQCSLFVVPTTHHQYSMLKQKLDYWLMDIPKGKNILADMTARLDWDDITPKCWYIIDFRATPDTQLTNVITLRNWEKLSIHAQNRLAFELYEKVKGLVIFADGNSQIPAVWYTLASWGMTSQITASFTLFLRSAINESPNNAVVYKTTDELGGFHRFENMPVYCSF